MKKNLLLSILIVSNYLSGQILCIKCYDQNDSISSGVHNLIKNGGFENNSCSIINFDCFCPNSSLYNCDISDWTCLGGGIGTYASIFDATNSQIPEGKKVVYFGNLNAKSCSANIKDTTCLINESCRVTGIPVGYPQSGSDFGGPLGISLQQTVEGLIIGNTYVLEFWAGGEDGFPYNGLFALNIGFGITFLRCKPTGPFSIDKGTTYLIQFKATSTSHTIKFTNWGHIFGGTELILDNVRLYTLAELSKSVTPCVTATNDLNEDVSISLFPNPFMNELVVKSNEPVEIILYDITSRKLLQQSFINSVSLNTEQLAIGIYFYELRNKNGMIRNGKVLKE